MKVCKGTEVGLPLVSSKPMYTTRGQKRTKGQPSASGKNAPGKAAHRSRPETEGRRLEFTGDLTHSKWDHFSSPEEAGMLLSREITPHADHSTLYRVWSVWWMRTHLRSGEFSFSIFRYGALDPRPSHCAISSVLFLHFIVCFEKGSH